MKLARGRLLQAGCWCRLSKATANDHSFCPEMTAEKTENKKACAILWTQILISPLLSSKIFGKMLSFSASADSTGKKESQRKTSCGVLSMPMFKKPAQFSGCETLMFFLLCSSRSFHNCFCQITPTGLYLLIIQSINKLRRYQWLLQSSLSCPNVDAGILSLLWAKQFLLCLESILSTVRLLPIWSQNGQNLEFKNSQGWSGTRASGPCRQKTDTSLTIRTTCGNSSQLVQRWKTDIRGRTDIRTDNRLQAK